jgi:cysteine synthase
MRRKMARLRSRSIIVGSCGSIAAEMRGAITLDQFANSANARLHRETTGVES